MDRRHLRAEDGVVLPHFLCKGYLLNGRRHNSPLQILLLLYTDGSDQRTDTDTGRTQVIDFIDLQTGIDLAAV